MERRTAQCHGVACGLGARLSCLVTDLARRETITDACMLEGDSPWLNGDMRARHPAWILACRSAQLGCSGCRGKSLLLTSPKSQHRR